MVTAVNHMSDPNSPPTRERSVTHATILHNRCPEACHRYGDRCHSYRRHIGRDDLKARP